MARALVCHGSEPAASHAGSREAFATGPRRGDTRKANVGIAAEDLDEPRVLSQRQAGSPDRTSEPSRAESRHVSAASSTLLWSREAERMCASARTRACSCSRSLGSSSSPIASLDASRPRTGIRSNASYRWHDACRARQRCVPRWANRRGRKRNCHSPLECRSGRRYRAWLQRKSLRCSTRQRPRPGDRRDPSARSSERSRLSRCVRSVARSPQDQRPESISAAPQQGLVAACSASMTASAIGSTALKTF